MREVLITTGGQGEGLPSSCAALLARKELCKDRRALPRGEGGQTREGEAKVEG